MFAMIKIIYTSLYRKLDCQGLNIENRQFHTYCVIMYKIMHLNEKDYAIIMINLML